MSIEAVDQAIRQETGTGSTDATKSARVRRGVYSMRDKPGHYMIRFRVPSGILTADQLDLAAGIAEQVGWPLGVHLTTRQGIEIPGVPADKVIGYLRLLEKSGITTFLTGGNGVRSVVSCPLSGVTPDAAFDITPYALAVDRYFQSKEEYQAMPRKFKIAFEGCAKADHVRTLATDFGARAVVRDGRKGFHVTVGGGLGALPKIAQVLEEFVPAEDILWEIESVLKVFVQYSNRENRAHSRLKWLLEDRGLEWFKTEFATAKKHLKESGQRPEVKLPEIVETAVDASSFHAQPPATDLYPVWKETNVAEENQKGLATVWVRVPEGDLSVAQLRQVGDIVRRFAGSLRLSLEQDLVLRRVPETALPELYEALQKAGLSACCANELADITRCAGADVCLSALTNSRAATATISEALKGKLDRDPVLKKLRIRVSGCPNSCSHHYAADIGVFGLSRKINDRPVPHYALVLGGSSEGGILGQRAAEVPALRVGQAVKATLLFYRSSRQNEETFAAFVKRVGVAAFKEKLSALAQVPPLEVAPAVYRDLGADGDFKVGARKGECAA
jgi:sulfite reductase beta subunit-like hemoprotein